ncbi:uroporphyrinogen-III C-methyltransferase [Lautropia mirabilis]|uniref:uroporphyrinogen-III C-methyltransferase n=1 Tax=Lautropia mirabilis TaxID=47671 RepID=UPI00234A99AB|nr:uroporphyrinogen-III C-methyltransferase [Lautropia mirabilis]MDC6093456.1 uroporphyrinogen-III C-methyltransferase [Lautropia mirabilis]
MSSEQQNSPQRGAPGSSGATASSASAPAGKTPAAGQAGSGKPAESSRPAAAAGAGKPPAPPAPASGKQISVTPPMGRTVGQTPSSASASPASAASALGKTPSATAGSTSSGPAASAPGTASPAAASASPAGSKPAEAGKGAAAAPSPAAPSPLRAAASGTGLVVSEPSIKANSGGGTGRDEPKTVYVQRRGWGWLAVSVLVVIVAAAGWWYMQQRFLAQERQNALRLQESESRAASLEEQVRQLRDLQQQLQTRGNALETRVAESSAQQEQLQALYDDVARVRGDARLAEVERAITLANQHLAVSGNVKGALLALEGAEKQLADSEQSQAIGLRRVILQDIEKLKSLPEVDLVRSVARMDEVLSRVETLPFLGDPDAPAADAPGGLAMAPAATEEAAPEEAPAEAPAADEPTDDSLSGKFKRWYHDLLGAGSRAATAAHEEFTSLVKIRRIDEPDRYLLGPDQKRSIRQGLRLQLLSARINLLNRNEALFRQDLAKSVETIQRFFDVEKPEVKSSINLLTELQSEPLQLKLPTLSDSMAALAAARAESEKRF